MAEQQEVQQYESDDETTPGYKPPEKKSVQELLTTDADDESLVKYKKSLQLQNVILYPEDKRNTIVTKLGLVADDRDEMILDLTGDLKELKKKPFIIKEGCRYHINIYFYVQREICAGLRYVQKTFRKGIKVDKSDVMVGSYGPNKDIYTFKTETEEAPKGMIQRGVYTIKSLFTDDDKHEHLYWEWHLEIKKDWE